MPVITIMIKIKPDDAVMVDQVLSWSWHNKRRSLSEVGLQ